MLATVSGGLLTGELRPQLGLLVEDMRQRLLEDKDALDRWRAEHREAVARERTAVSWTDWSEDQLTQAAVGWLLTSVFVRFCEDNLLLGETGLWITHPDVRLRQRALDAENSFYQAETDRSYREWLEVSFAALGSSRATAALVDEHAAIGIISPSSDAVNQLLQYWRRTDDRGELLWRFNDEDLSTRFLGDLYQDLSEYAKNKFALYQTPVFVEEFILDRTLTPALKDRPLEGLKLIDPTCGSGHFLLGAFDRLVDLWHREAPGLEVRARVNKALGSIYGVDVNPFAVAIAKFRLIVAALKQTGDRSLVNLPGFTLNVVNGDSLLHGPDALGRSAFDYGDERADKDVVASGFAYRTEDLPKLREFLAPGQYDVVVGNPPYITVKDKALNVRYRELYKTCKGKYALSVPFMEKFFDLAKPGERAGWVGQITSNSFMKREFGTKLIEDFLDKKDLRLVADTSGAYIPGHNTPTVILVGRNHPKIQETVRAVLGIQGEPGVPEDPGKAMVWSAIVTHIDDPGYQDQWITVSDVPRDALAKHPWSLAGGGAVETKSKIEKSSARKLSDVSVAIGMTYLSGEDDAFLVPASSPLARCSVGHSAPAVSGDDVRDYVVAQCDQGLMTCTWTGDPVELPLILERHFWCYRTVLSRRLYFGQTPQERGLRWYDVALFFAQRHTTALSIAFAEISTHNHFVLDRGGKVFKQTAPVIKLSSDATEEDHLRILGTLNSSTACFWLRQTCYPKGGDPVGSAGARVSAEPWSDRFQFNSTSVSDFPLSTDSPLVRAAHLDLLASRAIELSPASVIATVGPRPSIVEKSGRDYAAIRLQQIAEQEELDWEVYLNYGLIEENLFMAAGEAPGIELGQRSFEFRLARTIKGGEVESDWFARHGSTPITELPDYWPATYRKLIEKRLAVIESNPVIQLLESPEFKRRWAGDTWDVKLQRALRDWLLDKFEDKALWFTAQGTPQPLSVAELAGHVEKDPEFITALDMWAGQKDSPVTQALEKLLADQVVPYLAAMRYKESGLRKRAEWEHVWSLQRDQDAGLIKAAGIPIPPKYTAADFVKQSYWSHRGKLDVPKERFIVYPGSGRATDPTPLLGWAGWNYAQQGIALATIYSQRESEGAALSELIPLVAGIAEVLPWVKQWHSGVDPTFNLDLAEYLSAQLAEKSAAIGVPISDLPNWRPATPDNRRKKQ
jgi:hypothetical protein